MSDVNIPMTPEEIRRRQKLDQHYVGNVILTDSVIPGSPMIVSFKEKYTHQPRQTFISSITKYTVDEQQNYSDDVPKLRVWYSGPTTRAVRRTFADAGFLTTKKESNNWNLCWGSPKSMDFYETLGPGQVCNQIPGSNAMGRKDYLAEFMLKAAARNSIFEGTIPKTFILPQHAKELEDDMLDHLDDENTMYIYKPALGARGEGIEILSSRDTVPSLDEKYKSAVVQHYIMNPLLINGHKFDMRIYALITSIDPYILYIYEEGLGRFATERFIKPDITNKDHAKMHLTNFSINGQSDEGPIQDIGNGLLSKWKLTELLTYLDAHRELFNQDDPNSIVHCVSQEPGSLKKELYERIQTLVTKAMIATEPRMYSATYRLGLHCAFPRRNFGLYGFDVMISDIGDLKLIEINSSPATGTSTQIDVDIKFELLRDMMHLIGIPCYLDDKQNIIHPRRLVPKTQKEIAEEQEKMNQMRQDSNGFVSQSVQGNQVADIFQQQAKLQHTLQDGLSILNKETGTIYDQIQIPATLDISQYIVPPNQFISEFVVFEGEDHFSRTIDQLKDNQGQYVQIDLETITRFEQRCLWQILDEQTRIGRFTRLLPHPDENIGLLFETRRYLSELCASFLKYNVRIEDMPQ